VRPYLEKTHHKKGMEEWFKGNALSSNPSTEKKNQKQGNVTPSKVNNFTVTESYNIEVNEMLNKESKEGLQNYKQTQRSYD
jgi:hypothetical protein